VTVTAPDLADRQTEDEGGGGEELVGGHGERGSRWLKPRTAMELPAATAPLRMRTSPRSDDIPPTPVTAMKAEPMTPRRRATQARGVIRSLRIGAASRTTNRLSEGISRAASVAR